MVSVWRFEGEGYAEAIRFKQVFQTICAAAPTLGNLSHDFNDRREDIPVLVCQQGGRFDVVHFGNLMVKLDEVNGGLATGNSVETVFDDAAWRRL